MGQVTTYPSSFTVVQDGSGNFKTIQEAVNAVRDLSRKQVKILIKKDIYLEKLIIPSWKCRISLIGESNDSTIENITIPNKAGRVGQAVALHVEGPVCRISKCRRCRQC
ncbi:MAG: hypothetical protein J7621_20665 [Niastella sp.]|nr:hypothetical protein [Niastella sp.]